MDSVLAVCVGVCDVWKENAHWDSFMACFGLSFRQTGATFQCLFHKAFPLYLETLVGLLEGLAKFLVIVIQALLVALVLFELLLKVVHFQAEVGVGIAKGCEVAESTGQPEDGFLNDVHNRLVLNVDNVTYGVHNT